MVTPEEVVQKIRMALSPSGDFPVNARIVAELKELTSNPDATAQQITEVILREPSLGTRVLHLVNSPFYRRGKAILTVSQAVVQIGMKPLAELCSGLILLQRFVGGARRGGPFAQCLRKLLVTSLLSGDNPAKEGLPGHKADETGYLAGTFSELG